MGISAIRTFIAGVTRARALRACRLRKPLRSNAARYCITEVWLANPKWLWISRVLGVTPFSLCSRWMKSRTRLCRSVSMPNNGNESRRRQVQVNIYQQKPAPAASLSPGLRLSPLQAHQINQKLAPKIKHPAPRIFYFSCGSLFEDALVNVVRDLVAQILFHLRPNLLFIKRLDGGGIDAVAAEEIAMALIELPE